MAHMTTVELASDKRDKENCGLLVSPAAKEKSPKVLSPRDN